MRIFWICVDTATGTILGWNLSTNQNPQAPEGRTFINGTDLNLTPEDLEGKRWNGSAFVALPAPTVFRVDPLRFLDLLTVDEEIGLEMFSSRTDGTLQDQKKWASLRVWIRRLMKQRYVPLGDINNPEVAKAKFQLDRLKLVFIPSVWADTTIADARIAQILSNTPPV